MTFSFPISVYTTASNAEEWLNPNLQDEYIKAKEHRFKKKAIIPLIIGLSGFASIPFYGFRGFMLGLCLLSISVGEIIFLYAINTYEIVLMTRKSLKPFGGIFHFLSKEIQVFSDKKENEISCNYAKMENLLFCYKWKTKILIIKWQYEGKDYQYMLKVDNRERELITLFSFLYAEKVPFHEIDENGKKTYLLDLEIEKNIKEYKEAETYQNLIDEIGRE